jgi:hypothetical protein
MVTELWAASLVALCDWKKGVDEGHKRQGREKGAASGNGMTEEQIPRTARALAVAQDRAKKTGKVPTITDIVRALGGSKVAPYRDPVFKPRRAAA